MRGRVMVVAGSDSGGGAGIQADIKTIMALGGYATTAITAVTAQNTVGVQGAFQLPAAFVLAQMSSILQDIGTDAVKTGMLGDMALIEAVVSGLQDCRSPLVVDPVMVAKGGHALLPADAVQAVKTLLIPRAALVTPNVPEAEVLTGRDIQDVAGQEDAAKALLDMGAQAALVKGGHLEGDMLVDVLADSQGVHRLAGPRIATRHTHGTGCTVASAAAVSLAQALDVLAAVQRARAYVLAAIRAAPGFGAGHGPLDHGVWLMGAPA